MRFVSLLMSAVLLLAPIGVGLAHPPTADADPVPPPNDATVIGWKQMGLTDRIDLMGYNRPSDVGLPIPRGLGPVALNGQIGTTINVPDAHVDILDTTGALIGTIPLPAGFGTAPFSVDISAARPSAEVLTLSFVLRGAGAGGGTCAQPQQSGQAPAVALTQLVTAFSGQAPNPVTVADFVPRYLDRIDIRVGNTPTTDQQQAALDLVARLTNLYRPLPVRIDVDTSDAPAGPAVTSTSRVFEIRDRDGPGINVENPGTPEAVLVISGRGASLSEQTELFSDRRVLLAQTQTASVKSVSGRMNSSAQTLTFAQLDMSGQASFLGSTTMFLGFDASRFGVGSIDGAKVRLKAQYTAVEPGLGSILISAGNRVLASEGLDRSGRLDTSVEIPPAAITSNVGLALELRYLPDKECPSAADNITFALDSLSSVSVNPGTDNRGGFSALPMAFAPDFDVAVDRPDQLRFAARAINLLGQQTDLPLRPNIRPIQDSTSSQVGLLIVASGDKLKQLGMDPPLLPGAGQAVRMDGSPVTDVDLGGSLGIVQTFLDDGRRILAVTASGDDALLYGCFDFIYGLDAKWASLSGDVVATGSSREAVDLSIRMSIPQARPSGVWKWWTWISVSAGLIAVLAIVGVLVLRRVRGRDENSG